MAPESVWFIWAANLVAQNFMFTIVSRARNSGSLRRHVVAAIGSNGVWILQMQILMGPMLEYLNGKHGSLAQIAVGAYYTAFTVAGSVAAHYWALRTEKGKSAVGANAKYVQITRAEWESVLSKLSELSGRAPASPAVAQTIVSSAFSQVDDLERAAMNARAALECVDHREVMRLTRGW